MPSPLHPCLTLRPMAMLPSQQKADVQAKDLEFGRLSRVVQVNQCDSKRSDPISIPGGSELEKGM